MSFPSVGLELGTRILLYSSSQHYIQLQEFSCTKGKLSRAAIRKLTSRDQILFIGSGSLAVKVYFCSHSCAWNCLYFQWTSYLYVLTVKCRNDYFLRESINNFFELLLNSVCYEYRSIVNRAENMVNMKCSLCWMEQHTRNMKSGSRSAVVQLCTLNAHATRASRSCHLLLRDYYYTYLTICAILGRGTVQ